MQKKNISHLTLLGSEESFSVRGSDIDVIRKIYSGNSDPHWHDFYELEIIVSGSGIYEINGRERRVGVGDAYLVTPEDYHRLEAYDMEIYTICFNSTSVDRAIIDRIAGCPIDMIVKFPPDQYSYISKLLSMMEREFGSASRDREKALRDLLEYVLICFLRSPELTGGRKARLSSTVMQAVAYIKRNFKSNLTLTDVAYQVSVSPNYFGTLFKNEMGVTFSRYLMLTRLRCASNLLRERDMTIEEVAYASGFSSPSYFSESFRKEYGASPRQRRED